MVQKYIESHKFLFRLSFENRPSKIISEYLKESYYYFKLDKFKFVIEFPLFMKYIELEFLYALIELRSCLSKLIFLK